MQASQIPQLQQLPVTERLQEICDALRTSPGRFLILTAQTGAGKSTAVPLALLESFPKKILMLEPRRLAAIAVAHREAELLGEEVGQSCGYTVHLESRTGSTTRLEIMTEAVLVRRLQKDPSLEEASVVILDEFHERSMNADLALAFLKEAMSLRSDLFAVIMSATIDTKKLSSFCGIHKDGKFFPAPVLEIQGRSFAVETVYKPELSAAQAVIQELPSLTEGGTILAFLPGIAEIKKAQRELELLLGVQSPKGVPAQIAVLHSTISFEEQKSLLSPAPQNKARVILSSAIAETSLTIPDVVCVIDSGLSRFNRMTASGLSQLVTLAESEFSAAQRAGRAGRTRPGKCIRLWSKNDPRQKNNIPEILRADLSELVLECAEWGCTSPDLLEWPDAPQNGSWKAAQELLEQLECLDCEHRITALGKICLKLGLGVRLSLTAIFGGAQTALEYSPYKNSPAYLQKKFIQNVNARLDSVPNLKEIQKSKSELLKEPLLAGFPDRIAVLCKDGWQFPSGRVAKIRNSTGDVTGTEFIIATEAGAGETQGTIFSYKTLDSAFAEKWLLQRAKTETLCEFEDGSDKVKKLQITHYGKIILSQKKLPPDKDDFKKALCTSIEKNGPDILPFDERTKLFLRKAEFYRQQTEGGRTHNLSSPESLAKNLPCAEEWLLPFLTENKITAQNVYDALYYFFDGAEIEQKVPSRITLENGKSVKVNYEDGAQITPTVEIIIQQVFGCFSTPRILGKPVLLKLLSPARRPLQITSDLENFWNGAWPEICKEMRGRYPKHNWDYRG